MYIMVLIKSFANSIVRGVFPPPPAIAFPTQTIGTLNFFGTVYFFKIISENPKNSQRI